MKRRDWMQGIVLAPAAAQAYSQAVRVDARSKRLR